MATISPEQAAIQGHRGEDRFILWPLACLLIFPLALVAIWSGPFSLTFVAAPIVMISWGLVAFMGCVGAALAAVEGAWRRALSISMLPLVSLIALLNIGSVWGLAITAGEYIHFRYMRSSYLAHVETLPKDGTPRLAIFNWGGFGVSHGVVYDESDEIQRQESAEWKARINGTELECGVWGRPAGDHFYIVRIGC